MARIFKALNHGELDTLPQGEHCDGGGLYLRVTGMGGRSWIVKYQWAKEQEKIGIGSLAEVSLGIGFTDSFGRGHWAARQDILRALPYIREECEKAEIDWRSPVD